MSTGGLEQAEWSLCTRIIVFIQPQTHIDLQYVISYKPYHVYAGHGCQMAISKFLDRRRLALWA